MNVYLDLIEDHPGIFDSFDIERKTVFATLIDRCRMRLEPFQDLIDLEEANSTEECFTLIHVTGDLAGTVTTENYSEALSFRIKTSLSDSEISIITEELISISKSFRN